MGEGEEEGKMEEEEDEDEEEEEEEEDAGRKKRTTYTIAEIFNGDDMTNQSLIKAARARRIVANLNSKPGILSNVSTLMKDRSQLIDAYTEKFGGCIQSQTDAIKNKSKSELSEVIRTTMESEIMGYDSALGYDPKSITQGDELPPEFNPEKDAIIPSDTTECLELMNNTSHATDKSMQICLILEKIAQTTLNNKEAGTSRQNTEALENKLTGIIDDGTMWILERKNSKDDSKLKLTKMTTLSDECTFKFVNKKEIYYIHEKSGLFPNIIKKMKKKIQNDKHRKGHMNVMEAPSTTTEPLSDPKFSITQILLILFLSLMLLNEEAETDSKDVVWDDLVKWFEGNPTGPTPLLFPFADDRNKPTSRYLDGTLMPLLFQNFESGTIEVKIKLYKILAHVQNEVLFFPYLCGAVDGDGTLSGVVHGKDISSPRCTLGLLKDVKQSPMKALIKCMLPQEVTLHLTRSGVEIILTSNSLWTKCLFFWGCNMGLTMKYDQFVELLMTAEALELTRPVVKGQASFVPCLVTMARKIIGRDQSALNYAHGTELKQADYDERFTNMVQNDVSSLIGNAVLAGWFASDGTVCIDLEITQSNQFIIESMAAFIKRLLNVTPVIHCNKTGGDDGGHNKRYSYVLRINRPDVGIMALNVGIFDYNRRNQWLLVVLYKLISHSSNFQMKKESLKKLDDILKKIKKENKS
jgi:hypothetical protein